MVTVDAHGVAFTTSSSAAGHGGTVKIHTNTACSVTSVNVASGSTATRVYISTSATDVYNNSIGEASITSLVATFSTPVELADDTDYYVVSDNSGSNYNRRNTDTATFPYNETNVNFTDSGVVLTTTGDYLTLTAIYEIESITTQLESADTNMSINIGDDWKDAEELKINIGDDWKDVTSVKQNIGDDWKDVF